MSFSKSKFLNLILVTALLATTISNSQTNPVKLKYLGTAGWEITDGAITVLVDPYISRFKLGTGPGVSHDDIRSTCKLEV